MIVAVPTQRTIQNIETELDVVVPDFLLSEPKNKSDSPDIVKVLYHIIVTTKVSINKHKSQNENKLDDDCKDHEGDEANDEDVEAGLAVHFAVNKKFSEFNNFRTNLEKKYSETFVPPIFNSSSKLTNKISLLSKGYWKECREKQVAVDKFMKWCASTPKIAKSPLLIEFLGLNQLKVNINEKNSPQKNRNDTTKQVSANATEDLFDEVDDTNGEKENLFGGYENETDPTSDMFSSIDTSQNQQLIRLYSGEDLTGHVSANDNQLILFKEEEEENDQKLENKKEQSNDKDEEEELINIKEDIDDVVSQLKQVYVKTESEVKPKPESVETQEAIEESITVEIEKMETKELLKYINQNTDKNDEEPDLGF